MNEKLKGKVAIVTGSGRGLGKAFAISMVKQGIEVCIAEIMQETLDYCHRKI